MELNIFGIDDARTGTRGHGNTVAARTGRIGGIPKYTSQAARGKNRDGGQGAMNGLAGAVKHIGAITPDGTIIIQGIARVMGISDQVHRRSVGKHFDVGIFL